MERATTLSQSIINFLESASSAKKKIACCRCGAIMEHQKTTFFYECQSWNVELPVCIRCNPSPTAPKHDA
jgi:hypothetical protein